MGGPRHEVEISHNHIIHWEFGGQGEGVRGALSHSPNMKGNQTVNVNADATLALSPYLDFFPWEHRPYDL